MTIDLSPNIIEFRLHGRTGTLDPAARLSQAGRLPRVTQMMAMALSFQERLHSPEGKRPTSTVLTRSSGLKLS